MKSSIPPPRFVRPDPLVGSVINGKYRVELLVASGGMGKIYRGEQLALGRAVAIKVLHAHSTTHLDDPHFKKRFFREASILSKVQHPNVVTIFDYGAIDGLDEQYFMAMEFLAGKTLLRRLGDCGTLFPREIVRIAKQIARGLGAAHAAGIVHRDLKPANVMLLEGRPSEGEELVKVIDFGIVKVVGEEDSHEDLTQEGSFIGSPKYMAPEQITKGAKVDPRTDVYSLGIILYQALTGDVPFEAESSIQTMMAHLNQKALPIHVRAPDAHVPYWLDDLVMACIEKDPSNRPQTMDEVARGLTEGEATLATGMSVPRISLAERKRSQSTDSPTITETGHIASLPPNSDSLQMRRTGGANAPERKLAPIVAAAIALATLLVIIGLRVRQSANVSYTPPQPAIVALPGAQAPELASAVAPLPRKKAFQLVVESTPSGAEVREGEHRLGATPVSISIDNEGARIEPRKLTLAREGYQPYSIVQGPSDDNVRVIATLTPLSTAGVAGTQPEDAHAGAGAGARARAPEATPSSRSPKAPGPPDKRTDKSGGGEKRLDIRLTR